MAGTMLKLCSRLALGCVLAAAVMLVSPSARSHQTQDPLKPAPSPSATASSPAPSVASAAAADEKSADPAHPIAHPETKKEKDRLFSVVPDYTTVTESSRHELAPLTAGGKFKLAAQGAFDPGEFMLIGALAAEDQATNTDPTLGQGWGPFGERYALNFADQTIGTFMTTATFPAILHQDPRYFRCAHGSFFHRTNYALSHIVVTRGDSGRNEFNASEIFGNLAAAGIGNLYHPAEERTLAGTGTTWGTDIAVDALANVVKEFWPDIEHRLHWKQLPF